MTFSVPPSRTDGYLPLRGYALLGDGRSCALVGVDGAVDWWPLPTMDAPPTFGALLDSRRGGQLALQPVERFEVRRSYEDGGAVLITEFRTASGTVRLTDALTLASGATLPWSELARRVDCVDGSVPMRWHVTPGDVFGTTQAYARTFGSRPLISAGGQQLTIVAENVGKPQLEDAGFRGEFTAVPGIAALLAVIATDGEPTPVPSAGAVLRRLQETAEHWSRWRNNIGYGGPWEDSVARSAFVLKQLTLAATGALQAAGTTSLPERIGAARNFDYRFSWVRDTGFALSALTGLGLRGEVHAVLSYLLHAVAATAPDVRTFSSMSGEPAAATTTKVALWQGYRSSPPVCVGNSAAGQRQLGAYGDLLEAVARYADRGNVLDGATGQLVCQVAGQVCEQWAMDDAGLWELGQRRPCTSSKIGCWAALDRAARLADAGQLPPGGQVARWRACAEEIRGYINEACWSPAKRSYTFYAGTDQLDCAALLVARTGFCRGDDPRLHSTIEAVRAELSAGRGLLYRYSGMRDEEGAFLACSFWLVEALCHAGRLAEAREVMEEAVGQANDAGLLSEEVDPGDGEFLGNLPQTLSHLSLINAAISFPDSAAGEGSP